MRRRTLFLLVAVAALGAAWVSLASTAGPPEGCERGCAAADAASRPPGPLRILSMNVLHGFPGYDRQGQRLDLVADEIIRRNVDVALLQELPWNPWVGSGAERVATRAGMNHVFVHANGNRYAILFEEGSAILSRFPLQDVTWVQLTPAAGPFEHRIALAATVSTPAGDLRLVVTHLSGATEVNLSQATSLVDWLAGTTAPLVIGGDFNAVPGSPAYRLLTEAWTDAYWTVHPDDPAWTCCTDDLAAPPGTPMARRVDYLFLGGPDAERPVPRVAQVVLLDPVEVNGAWLRASDHAGLYVEVELGS